MASPTPNLALTYPAHGGAVNAWDTPLNADFDALDAVMAGTQTFAGGTVAFGNSVILTQTQANNRRVIISGVLTHDFAITFPAIGGLWVMDNQTTGAFNVTAITAGSAATPIVCSQTLKTLIGSNGTDMSLADNAGLHIIPFSGNPNGSVAGTAGSAQNPPSAVWDYTGQTLYVCTTTGPAAGAVWSTPNQPSAHGFDTATNLGLTITHTGGNLLNVALKTAAGTDPTAASPVSINFQALTGTATNGLPTTVNITSALSMTTFSTSATLGVSNPSASATITQLPFRIWVALFNNGGTPVLAIRNCVGITWNPGGELPTTIGVFPVAEYGIANTTAISAAATSPGVWYTPNGAPGLVSKAFRLIGYCEYTGGLATPGSFTADPNNIVLFGPGVKKPGDVVQIQAGSGTSLAITPTSSINLVRAMVAVNANNGSSFTATMILRHVIAATTVNLTQLEISNSGTASFPNANFTFIFLDATAATSSVNYTLSGTNIAAAGQGASGLSNTFFTLDEIMG